MLTASEIMLKGYVVGLALGYPHRVKRKNWKEDGSDPLKQPRVCTILGTMYPFERGGVDVLYTSIFGKILKEKQWKIVALARMPRKSKRLVFSDPLPVVTLPSLRSSPFGKLFEYIYLSFLDQVYFDLRISHLTETYFQDFDVILTPDPLLTVELCKRKNRPKVIQFMSGAWADTVARTQPFLFYLAKRIENEAYNVADKVVVMDAMYASRFNIHKERQVLIPNGVDLNQFSPSNFNRGRLRSHYGMTDRTVITTVGTLRKGIKGHEFLLQAIPSITREYPDAHFYLIGKGDQEHLRRLAESLRIRNNLHMLGERPDIPELLCASDVFILPSLTEGTPGALLEAMAMELPCIATRVGNIPEVIRQQQDGVLIDPANPQAITDAALYLLSNPEIANKLGVQARRRVEDHYNLHSTTGAYIKLIESMLHEI